MEPVAGDESTWPCMYSDVMNCRTMDRLPTAASPTTSTRHDDVTASLGFFPASQPPPTSDWPTAVGARVPAVGCRSEPEMTSPEPAERIRRQEERRLSESPRFLTAPRADVENERTRT